MTKEEQQAAEIRKEKFSDLDFSKHEMHVTQTDEVLIHHLKLKDTIHHNVKFINTNGILSVTGDYGNWIFCREFHPSSIDYVSAGYWCEKLRNSSEQTGSEFCQKSTIKEIEELLDGELIEQGYEGEQLEEMTEYLKGCLRHVEEGEFWYSAFAYAENPSFTDSEDVPFCKKLKPWLKYVFDAFNECCNRIANSEEQYYLQDSRDYCGNDVLWWAKDCNGYVTDIRKAHVFTKTDAIEYHQSRITDIPWPKEYIDHKTRPAVDAQYLDRDEALKDTGIEIIKPVLQKKERLKCCQCGRFVSVEDYYQYVYAGDPCPHCK